MKESLECAVCYETVSLPWTLVCGHTFCKACLVPVMRGTSVTCPSCRKRSRGVDPSAIPENKMLKAVVESLPAENTRCTVHGAVAEYSTCQMGHTGL